MKTQLFYLFVLLGLLFSFQQEGMAQTCAATDCELVSGRTLRDLPPCGSGEEVFDPNFSIQCWPGGLEAPDTLDPNACYRFFWDYGDGNVGCGNPHGNHDFFASGDYEVSVSIDKIYPTGSGGKNEESCGAIDPSSSDFNTTRIGTYNKTIDASGVGDLQDEGECRLGPEECIKISLLNQPAINEPFQVAILFRVPDSC